MNWLFRLNSAEELAFKAWFLLDVYWCYQIGVYIICTESGIKCQSTSSPQFIRGLLREINFNLNNSCVLLAHSVWLLLFFFALVVVVGALQPGVNGHLRGVEPWPRRCLFSIGSVPCLQFITIANSSLGVGSISSSTLSATASRASYSLTISLRHPTSATRTLFALTSWSLLRQYLAGNWRPRFWTRTLLESWSFSNLPGLH